MWMFLTSLGVVLTVLCTSWFFGYLLDQNHLRRTELSLEEPNCPFKICTVPLRTELSL